MKQFTSTQKANGEMAVRQMSQKAISGYYSIDPLAVYEVQTMEEPVYFAEYSDGIQGPMSFGAMDAFLSSFMNVYNQYGVIIDMDAATELMDDELREEVAADIAPCSDQEFFDEYSRRHEERFGEEWELAKANPTY